MKNLLLQALKFFGISGIGWLLDFGAYTLLGVFSENLFLNNVVSSWLGVTFTFVFSTRAVFKSAGRIPLWAKYAVYLLYQAVLIFCISRLLEVIDGEILRQCGVEFIQKSSYIIAKIIVTPITMVLNFLVMKGLMERI